MIAALVALQLAAAPAPWLMTNINPNGAVDSVRVFRSETLCREAACAAERHMSCAQINSDSDAAKAAFRKDMEDDSADSAAWKRDHPERAKICAGRLRWEWEPQQKPGPWREDGADGKPCSPPLRIQPFNVFQEYDAMDFPGTHTCTSLPASADAPAERVQP